MFNLSGDKRKIVFTRDISEIPTIVGKKNVKAIAKYVRFKGETYPINIQSPAYRKKNVYVYLYDIDKGQLTLKDSKNQITDELVDMIFGKEMGTQLVAGLDKRKFTGDIILILMGIFLGVAVGYILGNVLPLVSKVASGGA